MTKWTPQAPQCLRGDLVAAPLRDFHPKILMAVILLHVAWLSRLLGILFYLLLCFHFRAIVLLQCCMLCHIVVQVILMLVSVCVSFFLFMLVPSVVNLGMALDSVAFCFLLQVLLLDTRLSISF